MLRSANPLAQLQACEELKTRNLHHDITIMANIFTSLQYDDEIKSVLLIILHEQKIDYDFLVKKTFQQKIVNPIKLNVNFYAYMLHE